MDTNSTIITVTLNPDRFTAADLDAIRAAGGHQDSLEAVVGRWLQECLDNCFNAVEVMQELEEERACELSA